jgi:hypothetical protein
VATKMLLTSAAPSAPLPSLQSEAGRKPNFFYQLSSRMRPGVKGRPLFVPWWRV